MLRPVQDRRVAAAALAYAASPTHPSGGTVNRPNYPELKIEKELASGFLVDRDIRFAIGQGQLIHDEVIAASSKYACYEVHIGDQIQQMVVDEPAKSEADLYRVKNIPSDGKFSIKPGETYKLYAKERLDIPSDVFAIAIPVGNMYKLGLNPETTFADPGFANAFYITVCNYSRRIVNLTVGDPLARLFFFKLASRPDKIHESTPREVPPAVVRLAKRPSAELEASGEESLLKAVLEDVDPPHYEHAFVTNRLLTTHATAIAARIERVERRSAASFVIAACSLLVGCAAATTI
jgi:deoxycytidine triphosphate deaminase